MLSGNGRHRRPRQAPALLVAAGVTGSAIAIPLLGASGASAATSTTWDRVADCESGGAWSADTGNGLYGGLQLTQEEWEKYGGLDYAMSPDLASRSQQIAVGEKILADTGIQTWPTCGLTAGLADSKGSPGVDTGLPLPSSTSSAGKGSDADEDAGSDSGSGSASGSGSDTAKADTFSGSSASSGSSSGDGESDEDADASSIDHSGADRANASESDNSPQSADSSTHADSGSDSNSDRDSNSGSTSEQGSDSVSGSGRHRGGSADETLVDGARDGDASARHASRGSAAARDAVDGSYTVRPGDNLSGIADSLGLAGGWTSLYDANERTVGADPDHIVPGQSLRIGNADSSDAE